ncbi:O-linked N-acetylglucosamine transferase, SPINDLY family protein [Allocoleopsis franciscana]|uniref:Putative O-linked N-acetylglucosamine transferase, SPINDLY family n=1 Tax=Allocoleopsis franciscana PCC 7113 TaxID=1173027 RepID=K9WAL7_9CYAN|nr:O-linked N-acetylglucosamine transferase, SPINDLY family [Allocoleopsis franciscana]AFZ17273.1 putative O-linked N-acetylglucosamine transferase, SPINDLY family [Allocoleopsis franciscana PCC 7113]
MINQRTLQVDIAYHFDLIQRLQKSGKTQEAISAVENACNLFPDEYLFKLIKNLFIPIIYSTSDEVSFYHQRFKRGLQDLIEQTSLGTPEEKSKALAGINHVTNFYLAYQAGNIRELQQQYGTLVHKIVAANYPQWLEPRTMPQLEENQKIRVGYISKYIHNHSSTFWLLGWLRHCNRNKFEVYCYYIGNQPDTVTYKFKEYSDVFNHIPENLESVCKQIVTDNLHILVFPELGIDALTFAIAGLRLAPVQCTDWGYPVTSGIPTIDYYISSELMEPENAQKHYSETLICLPNLGIAYPQLEVPSLTKTRSDFGLRDDAVVYLCCQAPYKYLPQHDFIFVEIAKRVPQAQFVFVRADVLKPRLKATFAAVGKSSEDYCVFLSFLNHENYLRLNLLSDVFLDTLGFTGGNTTLAALACNLPVVTCPGECMRGYMSTGMLKMLRLSETIAENEAEYIEIAVRLGLEPTWRHEIVQYTMKHGKCLFNDKSCVAALEEFYQGVVRERLRQS